jgi:hypothetical protein
LIKNQKFYINIFRKLISKLSNIETILEQVNESCSISELNQLINIYDALFLSAEIKKHIFYRISFVGKSSDFLFVKPLNDENAHKHITLELLSEESIWLDQVYDNKLSDLLKYFKYLFSTIENFSIYENVNKIKRFQRLTEEIKNDIKSFISINEEAEKRRAVRVDKLKKKEAVEKDLISQGNKYKSNWQVYLNVVIKNNIRCLYHFTDRENLESIKVHKGLYSWWYCIKNNIIIKKPGGDDLSRNLDKGKGSENYVRLSFCRDMPMMYLAKKQDRIMDPVILNINTEVIYYNGTKFCNMNATRTEAEISDDFCSFQAMNFKLFSKKYFDLSENDKVFYQAEVLAYEHVPIDLIININEI